MTTERYEFLKDVSSPSSFVKSCFITKLHCGYYSIFGVGNKTFFSQPHVDESKNIYTKSKNTKH